MATKTALNVACVQIFGSLDEKPTMNDLYYRFAAQPTHEQLVSLCSAIAGVVTELWSIGLPAIWKGRSVFAFDMTVADGANAVDDTIAGLVGTFPGDPLPNSVTFAIARKNGLRGRSGNGRIFWQGVTSEALEDANHVTSTWAADRVTDVKAMDTAAADVEASPVILSFQSGGVFNPAAHVYDLDTWLATDFRLDTRRKRLPKSGS